MYGPASTSVATDATPGPEPANAPVSNQMRPAFAVMRPSFVTPVFSSTTVPWRGYAAVSSSTLVVMTFTGRPVAFARKAAKCSTPTRSLPPKPPPIPGTTTRIFDGAIWRISASVFCTSKGSCVFDHTVTWPELSHAATAARGSV